MIISHNVTTTAGGTTTSETKGLPPGHSSITYQMKATQPGTFTPYAREEASRARIPLSTAITLTSVTDANGETYYVGSVCVLGTFVQVDHDYANSNATVGKMWASVQLGGRS